MPNRHHAPTERHTRRLRNSERLELSEAFDLHLNLFEDEAEQHPRGPIVGIHVLSEEELEQEGWKQHLQRLAVDSAARFGTWEVAANA